MDDAEFLAEMREDFLESAPSELETCESCLLRYEKSADENEITEFKRFVHSIKGGARCVGLNEFSNFLHGLETKLQAAAEGGRMKQFVHFALPFIDGLRGYVEATVEGDDARIEEEKGRLDSSLSAFN